ncbi:MAG: GSCFA domain-containing protein [Tannerellaceae bacterium]|nr:GSCFA domain-containing protein [Tannerellaceae bacterium]
MQFTTPVYIPQSAFGLGYRDRLLLMGSCFAVEIGQRMAAGGLDALINPFGILYNPLSIAIALRRLMHPKPYVAADLFYHNEQFHSFDHHGGFSRHDLPEALAFVNSKLSEGAERLSLASYIVVSWGNTALFRCADDDRVAGNCHKLPARHFRRERLGVEDIVSCWRALVKDLKEMKPDARLILTVSPVRYLGDGARQNSLSKSAMLIAAEELEREFGEHISYFPAYELMIDELRDYRFYAPDMLHPSSQAVDYIWERFRQTFFAAPDHQLFAAWEEIQKALRHVPTRPDSAEYRQFVEKTLEKVEEISRKFPYFDTSSARQQLQSNINR